MLDTQTALLRRGYSVLARIKRFLPDSYPYGLFIAGSSIASPTAQFRDVDIFCQTDSPTLLLGADVLTETVNAVTYDTVPWPCQVCSARSSSLEELILGFDFTHVQAGVEIRIVEQDWRVTRTYCTPRYINACVGHSTAYTHVPKPLASLLRLAKYHARGDITPEANAQATIELVVALLKTGFESEVDFRNQLVGWSDTLALYSDSSALTELYQLLHREGKDACET